MNNIINVISNNNKVYLILDFNKLSDPSLTKTNQTINYKGQNVPIFTKTIRIFSWNICWEKMQGKKALGKSCKDNCYNEFGKYLNNTILDNYDILCFQEASDNDPNVNYNKHIENFKFISNNTYEIQKHKSGKDAMITLFKKKKFTFRNRFYGDLSKGYKKAHGGRPFLITILENNYNSEIILLCNVHFPHNQQTPEKILKDTFQIIYNQIKFNRIIVVGDHNHNYYSHEFTQKISFDKNKFKFYNNRTERPNTLYSKQIDLVSDTKSKPKYYKLNVPKFNGIPVSDHSPISATLKL